MSKIKKITAREILDSRGWPAISIKISADNGLESSASAANGDDYEIKEFQDGEMHRYKGKGLLKAIRKIEDIISPLLIGQKIGDQKATDEILTKLDNKTKETVGRNSLFALSSALARLGAMNEKQELFSYLNQKLALNSMSVPVPIFNIFDGGAYADTNLDFQEFLIIPKKASAAEMVRIGAEVFHELAVVLEKSGYDTDTGSEGGYAPDLDSSIEAIELILAAAINAGYQPGKDIKLGIDIASSLLYEAENKKYIFSLDHAQLNSSDLISLYNNWLEKYPLIYLEDALAESDYASWSKLTAELGGKLLIAGDDLFKTNIDSLRRGLKEKMANTILIKPGQAGTLTEIADCIKLAQKHNYRVVLSQEIGETNDDFIADLAYACGADFLKSGSLARGERVAKYNRLMEIENLVNN